MSNTRSLRNRSSRYSSPATFTTHQENGQQIRESLDQTVPIQNDTAFQQNTRLDTWVEPAPRNAVASFEDVKGLERLGVLEHMQPLGLPPNQKLLQKLKVTWNRGSMSARASPVIGESADSPTIDTSVNDIASPVIDPALLMDEYTPTPTKLTPAIVSNAAFVESDLPNESTFQFHTQAPILSSPVTNIRNGNHSFVPTTFAMHDANATPRITSPPRGRPAKKEVEEMKVYTTPDDTMFSSGYNTTPRASRGLSKQSSNPESQTYDRFRGYLHSAIALAQDDNKPELVAGLAKVLAEMDRDELFTAIDNMSKFKQSVRLEQFKVFKRYIKKGIREHRRTSSLPHATGIQQAQISHSKPVAYVSSFHMNTKKSQPADHFMTENNGLLSPVRLSTKLNASSLSASPGTKRQIHKPSIDGIALPDPSTEKLSDRPTTNILQIDRESSFSSLSSALSHPEEIYIDPESPILLPETQPTKTLVQRQAPARVMSKRVSRSFAMAQPSDSSSTSNPPTATNTPTDNQHYKTFGFDVPRVNPDSIAPAVRKPRKGGANASKQLTPAEQATIEQKRREFQRNEVRNYNYRPVKELADRQGTDTDDLVIPMDVHEADGPSPPVLHEKPVPIPENMLTPAVEHVETANTANAATGIKRSAEDAFADEEDNSTDHLRQESSPPPPSKASKTRNGTTASSSRASTPRVNGIQQNRPERNRSQNKSATSTDQSAKRDATETLIEEDGDAQHTIQNDDECWACGDDSGELHCCDGCPRSFHAECLAEKDDNLNKDASVKWYCPICLQDEVPKSTSSGPWGPLIDQVNNPGFARAFNLTYEIRSYFEDVTTGEDGEYVEIIRPPIHKKGQPRQDHNGAAKLPDYTAERDSKGVLRVCCHCKGTTQGRLEMIPCDYCHMEWHFNCLPKPFTTPPKQLGPDGKAPKPWTCPRHVSEDLRAPAPSVTAPGSLGWRPRNRRAKGSTPITPHLERRFANNGFIEIAAADTHNMTFKNMILNGSTYRVPEIEIKHDFIAKAKMDWYRDNTIPRANGQDPRKFHSQSWTPARRRSARNSARVSSQQGLVADRSGGHSTQEQQAADVLLGLFNHTVSHSKQQQQTVRGPSLGELVDTLNNNDNEGIQHHENLTEAEKLRKVIEISQKRIDDIKDGDGIGTEQGHKAQINGTYKDSAE